MKEHWADSYRVLEPCPGAWRSVLSAPSSRVWWETCERGDWMLWAISRSPELNQRNDIYDRIHRIAIRVMREIVIPWNRDFGRDNSQRRSFESMKALARWCRCPCERHATEWHAARGEARNILRENGSQAKDQDADEAVGEPMLYKMAQIIRSELPCSPLEAK